jgi:hypothetical protein
VCPVSHRHNSPSLETNPPGIKAKDGHGLTILFGAESYINWDKETITEPFATSIKGHNVTQTSEDVVRTLRHHFRSVDPDMIAKVVHELCEDSRTERNPRTISPTPTSSTVPEPGFPVP